MNYSILLISTMFYSHILCNYLSIDYKKATHRIYIDVKLNQSESDMHALVNTFLPFSLFEPSLKLNKKSAVKKSIDISLSYNKTYDQYTTSLSYHSLEIDKYSFLYGDSSSFKPDNGFSFGHLFEDESFSIVHQLYNSHQIKYKTFAFKSNLEHINGKIYFGGIPDDKDYQFKGYCKVDDTFPNWGCNLTQMNYNDTSVSFNNYALFHSGFYGLLYSDNVFDFIANVVFKKEIENKICYIEEISERRKGFNCQNSFKNELTYEDTFEFVFGNIQIKYPKKLLFDESSSIFFTNPYDYYLKYDIILGVDFINSFNYTIFDYDNNQIGFYSDKIAINISSNNNRENTIKSILILSLSLNAVDLILLLFIKQSYMNTLM